MHFSSCVRMVCGRFLVIGCLMTSGALIAESCVTCNAVESTDQTNSIQSSEPVVDVVITTPKKSASCLVARIMKGAVQLGLSCGGLWAIIDAILSGNDSTGSRVMQGGLGVLALCVAGLMAKDDGMYIELATQESGCEHCWNPDCYCHNYHLMPVYYHDIPYPLVQNNTQNNITVVHHVDQPIIADVQVVEQPVVADVAVQTSSTNPALETFWSDPVNY